MRSKPLDVPLDFLQVVAEEHQAISASGAGEAPKTAEELIAFVHRQKSSALCLSGGGIRSATFCLGVLQGLVRLKLLARFDYLSTVSGGGYIGSWLTAWAHREESAGGINHVQDELASNEVKEGPVQQLRRYSNYLSPRVGVLSSDTWTLVSTFVRNLLLNWLVLAPVLLVLVSVPAVCRSVVRTEGIPAEWVLYALGAGLAGGVVSMFGFGRFMPDGEGPRASIGTVLALCVTPLFVTAICYTTAWGWLYSPLEKSGAGWVGWILENVAKPWGMPLASAIMHALGCVLGCVWRSPRRTKKACALLTFAAAVVAYLAAVGSVFLYDNWGVTASTWWVYVCLASPVYLSILLAATALLVTPLIESADDLAREWITRVGAWIVVSVFGWTLFSLAAVFGPDLVRNPEAAAGVVAAGGLSGWLTALLGFGAKTVAGAARKKVESGKIPFQTIVSLFLAPVFLILLLVGLSAFGQWSFDWLCSLLPWFAMFPHDSWRYGVLVAAAAVLAAGASLYVDPNKFSLHGMYRNRLIRAYLGASRRDRDADPFTDFDKGDNVFLKDLTTSRPFHVINAALNLAGGTRLEWQQRKAESFTFSKLHAGACELSYRRVKSDDGRHYGGPNGVSLGTAVAISGAAVNPNMGYNSSPLVTFLLTLFNARLGWWLGNPGARGAATWHRNGPRFSLGPLISEAFSLTSDRRRYVNLSDGGHFENLGLYEMVRRRCHLIVVIDASADPRYAFEDLAGAIRKIQIDFGVSIEIDTAAIHPRKGDEWAHWAKGVIRYTDADQQGVNGQLLYLKPVLTGDEGSAVQSYRRSSEDFPHESTADQFFSESQFESYRELGFHSAMQAAPSDIASFFAAKPPLG